MSGGRDPVADAIVWRDGHRRSIQIIKDRARNDLNAEQYALYMEFLTGEMAKRVAKHFGVPLTAAEEAVAQIAFQLRYPNRRQPSRFHLFDSEQEIAEQRARVMRDYLNLGYSSQDAAAQAQEAPFQLRAQAHAQEQAPLDYLEVVGKIIAQRYRPCERCSRFIIAGAWKEVPKGRKRRYCSDRCRQASYRRRSASTPRPMAVGK